MISKVVVWCWRSMIADYLAELKREDGIRKRENDSGRETNK